MKRILGKKLVDIESVEFAEIRAAFDSVLVDIGTGDGKFVLTTAREFEHMFCLGLEPAWERASQSSNRALRKVEKGGAPNAFFICAAVENIPHELNGVADVISINYPWGSLLSGVCSCKDDILSKLARLGRPGTKLVINLNTAVFDDPMEREKLLLPFVDDKYVQEIMQNRFASHKWILSNSELLRGKLPVKTTWGAQLVKGSLRNTLLIEFFLGK